MPEAIWQQKTSTDILQDIRDAAERLKNTTRYPQNIIMVSECTFKTLDYCLKTVIVSEWSGYDKKQGPDGKIWFVKKPIPGIDKGRGGGNKANRRMGLEYYDDRWLGPCWKKPVSRK